MDMMSLLIRRRKAEGEAEKENVEDEKVYRM